uniref:Uncharacterized protein n=1 Tax=Parascaris univalens TaxID=6257 RepID=A0A915BBC8_PARUN
TEVLNFQLLRCCSANPKRLLYPRVNAHIRPIIFYARRFAEVLYSLGICRPVLLLEDPRNRNVAGNEANPIQRRK